MFNYSITKSLSYHSLAHLTPTRAAVVQALIDHGPLSRIEIAEVTGLRLSSVCGRCNELLKTGEIEPFGTKLDPISGKTVQLLRVANAPACSPAAAEYAALEVAV